MFNKKIKYLPNDDFLNRIPSSVIGQGMLHPGNPYLFDLAISKMPKKGSVVEIGSYGGLSTNVIIYLLGNHKFTNTFFTCDPWIYEGYQDEKGTISETMDGRDDVSRKDYMNHIKASFIQSTRLLSSKHLPATYRLTSDEFFFLWSQFSEEVDVFGNRNSLGGEISFAYIDGYHSYEQSNKDFDAVRTYALDGAYVLLDDSGKGMPFGSARLAQELLKDSSVEMVAKNPNYLFRIHK